MQCNEIRPVPAHGKKRTFNLSLNSNTSNNIWVVSVPHLSQVTASTGESFTGAKPVRQFGHAMKIKSLSLFISLEIDSLRLISTRRSCARRSTSSAKIVQPQKLKSV